MTDFKIPIKLAEETINGQTFRATTPARGSADAAGYDLCAYLPSGKFKVQRIATNYTTCETFDPAICLNTLGCHKATSTRTTATTSEQGEIMDNIPQGCRALIPTGVSVAISQGWYGRNAPRSGLAWKNGLDVMAGVIDADYRGDVGVVLVNLGGSPFQIRHGDRIAQIIFERCADAEFQTVDVLPDTNRGAGGYGSTGISKTDALPATTGGLCRGSVAPCDTITKSIADRSPKKEGRISADITSKRPTPAYSRYCTSNYDPDVVGVRRSCVCNPAALDNYPNDEALGYPDDVSISTIQMLTGHSNENATSLPPV